MGSESPVTIEKPVSNHPSPQNPSRWHILPTYHHNGQLVTKGIQPEGESGRAGFHPLHFFRVMGRSATKVNMLLNILWPFTIAAIVCFNIWKDQHVHDIAVFALSIIGIVPAASTLDFSAQEFARKLPRVIGIVVETFFGGVVEIVLFMVLLGTHGRGGANNVIIIQGAIIGSILANLLLCLGGCFFVGGLRHKEQKFHKVISEVGSGILLMAGFALLIPSAFYSTLNRNIATDGSSQYDPDTLTRDTRLLSRGTAVVLFVAFFVYMIYNVGSHDSIFDEVLNHDEERDRDRAKDLAKQKLTMTESVVGIVVCLALVSYMAYVLVYQIEPMVADYGFPENFLGLIIIPVVEKAAEHLSALDEAYDDQINFALFHCLAPSIQTALFNAPLAIFVAWGLGIQEMNLNFEIFFSVLLLLAIIVVGNVLRDGSSDYLEGALLMFVYIIIAVAAFLYPDASVLTTNGQQVSHGESSGTGETVEHAVHLIKRLIEAGHLPRDL